MRMPVSLQQEGCLISQQDQPEMDSGLQKVLGHTVTDCMPALVLMECKEEWVPELQGLSLRNVNVTILDGKKKLYDDFGEMLFTHYGAGVDR